MVRTEVNISVLKRLVLVLVLSMILKGDRVISPAVRAKNIANSG